ncbi:GNAT family N-acetyltransferase [Serinibacter arcticus]|uniref:GNAT family N-acetyltransferase n=1 Tax=Serinibacter arcticus TaxID=1655435 RepID=A0A2U1ZZ93_9MICO|nr:GNAT family N-acetyltransferase [Serinibacter arcticus]
MVLRPPTGTDEVVLRRIHEQLRADGFTFLLADGDWPVLLAQVQREADGVDLPPGRVRSDFLVAEVDGVLVGRVSVRHELNAYLLAVGGHVGYAVAPEHRRRGYASRMLQLSVERLGDLGVARVLVTCDDDNEGSAAVIERCGGVLEDVVSGDDGVVKRRYWIDASVR